MAGVLNEKIALITGASRGIGAAVAKRFAAEGAQVVLVARSMDGLEAVDDAIRAAGGLPPVLLPMDLRDGERIDAIGPALYERFGRLDIFVANAAYLGELGPLAHQSPKQWDTVMRVNVDANWRLLRTLDPILRISDAGRVIAVTSGVAATPVAYWGPYAASKAALENLMETYAEEVKHTPVQVHVINPGIVATAMRAAAFPGENPAQLMQPDEAAARFVPLAQ
jgi:NAD(P)-dependent dehydrogenase (short-subunit alcohol dehydrogenase family)